MTVRAGRWDRHAFATALLLSGALAAACGGPPPAVTSVPPSPVPASATVDAGEPETVAPLPPELAHRAVRDPGYSAGIAREWKVCVLDDLRERDVRCGRELLSESSSLSDYRVSDGCRVLATSVGRACAKTVRTAVDAALPAADDVAKCRDALDDAACDRVAARSTSPLFANRGGVGCTVCGRHATDFVFGANRPTPVPAADALPFTQDELDAAYARLDAALGALAMRRCARASTPIDCEDLQDLLRWHPAHPDAAIWEGAIARMRSKIDDLTWNPADPARCVRQRIDQDESACAALRSYVDLFPAGHHVKQARDALARSAPGRKAREHVEAVEDCRKTCASPPLDWGMGPGPAYCARILGRTCK